MRQGQDTKLQDVSWPGIVRPGSLIVWGQGCAEPTSLTASLVSQRHAIASLRAFIGISFADSVAPEYTDAIEYVSYCGTARNRTLGAALDILPANYSELPGLLGGEDVVLLLQLAPGADEDHFSFGAGAEYPADLIDRASIVIAEINSQAPVTGSGKEVHRKQLDMLVHTSTPLAVPPPVTPTKVEEAISRNVANLIEDGATIQVGLGGMPAAVLKALTGHRDLGVHSGLITNEIADLAREGVITNAYKSIDRGLTVTGLLSGDATLMRWADRNPDLSLRPTTYMHAPDVLRRIDKFVAINSAIEIDLTGQVNAEVAGGRYVGAVGGAGNFLRGAMESRGGLGIIALPATAKGRSRIVKSLSGPVSTARSNISFVVTEFGVADLRNATLRQRQDRLLAIAAPQFQSELAV